MENIYLKLKDEGLLQAAWEQFERHRSKPDDKAQCVFTDFATPKGEASYGHSQVRFRGVKYYCHILAAMVNTKRAPNEGEEASHLCSNGKCVNPEHLTFESALLNKTRMCCAYFLGKDPKYNCPHSPACITRK